MSIQQMQRRIAKLERQRALSAVPLTTGGVPAWMRNGSVGLWR